jgi:hypothetical protein
MYVVFVDTLWGHVDSSDANVAYTSHNDIGEKHTAHKTKEGHGAPANVSIKCGFLTRFTNVSTTGT